MFSLNSILNRSFFLENLQRLKRSFQFIAVDMEYERDASANITRQDINNFPFQYKLWVVVNSETCDFCKWTIDGTEFNLDIAALDDYLSSAQSIFKVKSLSAFIAHLRDYDFYVPVSDPSQMCQVPKESCEAEPRANSRELAMHFKHEHFLRHRIDLLAKVRRVNNSFSPRAKETETKLNPLPDRMEGDLCFAPYGTTSKMQKVRIKYQTILKFQSETLILQKKLRASESGSKTKAPEEDSDDLIELPANMFENPYESVLYMGEDHRSAYAGFYGNCSNEKIAKFFGDYLPMYENVNDDQVERRVLDLNPLEKVSSNVSLSAAQMVDDMFESLSPPLVASSSLQPVFIGEDDISMEEFIRFNEQSSDTQPVESEEKRVVKKEEDDENEANFKNFFRQYRESLSLLYEKQ